MGKIQTLPDCGFSVLGIRNVYPRSDFFPSRIRIFSIPDPGSSSKNLSILTQKNGFSALGNLVRVVHTPDPDPDFWPTHRGSRIQGSERHRIPGPDPQQWIFFSLCIQSRGPFFLLQSIFTKNLFSLLAWGVGRGGGSFCTRDRSTSQQQRTSEKQHSGLIRPYQTQQMQSVLSRSSQPADSTGR